MKYILIITIFLIPAICLGQSSTSFDKVQKYNATNAIKDSIAKAKKDSVTRVLNTPILSINDLAGFAAWINAYNPDKGRNAVIIAELERIIGEAQKRKQSK